MLIARRILYPALLCALLFAGRAWAAEETIRLGVVGAYSGNLAPYGIGMLNAAQAVVERANAAGGIAGGKKLELLPHDDQCDPDKAYNAANTLVNAGVKVVIGHLCTSATQSALNVYNRAKIISISPSSSLPELTTSGKNPYFFRTVAMDDSQARLAAQCLEKNLKVTKAAILHDKSDYGMGYAEFVRKQLNRNRSVKVTLFSGIDPKANDYTTILKLVRASGAEALVFGGYDPEAVKLVSQMRELEMDIPLISLDGIKSKNFINMAGPAAEGVYASAPREVMGNRVSKNATEDHQKAFGDDAPLSPFYMEAYAAVLAAINAMDKSGGDQNTQKLAAVLRNEYVNTPLGRIRFNRSGDAEGVGFVMFKVIDGKFMEIK
ncbi:MAG: branched-chain amino acid ABC transporter substrate-binding protein [Deltaproteobacteria bacterium]|nr:branched-chain amino acid ABC transporter substrate-binding protein [Deltaproteobacteria bacterium]